MVGFSLYVQLSIKALHFPDLILRCYIPILSTAFYERSAQDPSYSPWEPLEASADPKVDLDLVPVVVHFPKLIWFLAFSVTLAPVRVKRKWTRSGSFSAMFASSP